MNTTNRPADMIELTRNGVPTGQWIYTAELAYMCFSSSQRDTDQGREAARRVGGNRARRLLAAAR